MHCRGSVKIGTQSATSCLLRLHIKRSVKDSTQQDCIVFLFVQKSEAVKSVKKDFVKNTTEAPAEEYEYEYYDDEEEESKESEESEE